jgi:long-chain fatty acid transport protein
MTRAALALLLLGSIPSLHPRAAIAGGTAVGEQNAVSAATGGAGAARDDDPGAAWHDPAALADGGGLRVGLSLALARPALEATAGGATTDSERAWATPPHLDASYAEGRWAAGLAVGVPFGGGVTWPSDWPGATQAVETQLVDVRVAPFFAWRLGPVRVAAGVHADLARLQIQRGLDFIDATGNVKIDLAGRGYGVDASLYYAPRAAIGGGALALGLAYRSRTSIHFSGPANFTAPDEFSEKTPDQNASTAMTLPDQLVLGARWRRGAVAALVDVEWASWSVNQRTTVDFVAAATPDAVQENQWHDTVAVRGGAEWTHGRLVARAGAYVDPSPVPADHLVPAVPDATRIGATLGASWQVARAWSIDAFGERMWLLRRDTTSTDTMPASYGGTALVVGAGVRWTPGATGASGAPAASTR